MTSKKQPGKLAQADFSDAEIAELIEYFLAVKGPDVKSLKRQYAVIKPYFSPTVVGLDNIPDEPTLFIGNHAMFALDAVILLPTVYHETGRFLRPMADNIWFGIAAGKRMAAKHGYNITPFGMVGPDDGWEHVVEGHDILHSRLVKLLQGIGLIGDIRDDILPPIPRGVFNTWIPKPQHCFLAFGEPIEVPDRRGKKGVSERIQKSIRKQTADSIESLVKEMLAMRTRHRSEDGTLRRFLTR